MALNNWSLGFILTARDRASRVIQNVGVTLDRTALRARLASTAFQVGMTGVMAGLGTLAAGIVGVRAGIRTANLAGEWELELRRVQAISQATAAEMAALREATVQAGATTWFSPTQVAQAERELSALGLTAQETIGSMPATIDLAVGGMIDMNRSAQTLGAAMRVFGLDASRATWIADRLLNVVNTSALSAEDLLIALGNVSRGATATGQTMETMLNVIGLVRNTGVAASVAAASTSAALLHMSKRSQDVYRTLRVRLTDPATGQFRDMVQVLYEMGQALAEIPDQARRAEVINRLGGRYGMTTIMAVQNQINNGIRTTTGEIVRGQRAIEFLANSAREADGTARRFRQTVEDSFLGVKNRLVSAAGTLATLFGESLGQVVTPVLWYMWKLVSSLALAFNQLSPSVRRAFAALFIAITGATVAFGAMTIAAMGLTLLLPLIGTVALTFGVLLAIALPLVGAIGMVTAAVASFGIMSRRNIGGFGDYVASLVNKVKLFFRMISELFRYGGLTKTTMIESRLEDNLGLRRLAARVYAFYFRLQMIWKAVQRGFTESFWRIAPALDPLWQALRQVGTTFGFLTDSFENFATSPLATSEDIGMAWGQRIGDAIRWVIQFVTRLVTEFDNFIVRIREWGPEFQDTWALLVAGGRSFLRVFEWIFGAFSTTRGEATTFGARAADALGTVLVVLGNIAAAVLQIITFFMWLSNVIRYILIPVGWLVRALGAITAPTDLIRRQVSGRPPPNPWATPASTAVPTPTAMEQGGISSPYPWAAEVSGANLPTPVPPTESLQGYIDAQAAREGRRAAERRWDAMQSSFDAMLAGGPARPRNIRGGRAYTEMPPININLTTTLDGQVLSQQLVNVQRNNDQTRFSVQESNPALGEE